MLRRLMLGFLVVFGMVAATTPALAGKGGNGNGGGSSSGTSTSTIIIASIDGATAAASTNAPTPKLGDSLTFATSVEPLAGWEYPMVALSCYQDVNGDGKVDTNLLGPDIVFANSTSRTQHSTSAATRRSGHSAEVATRCAAPSSMRTAGRAARSRYGY
jgi:hypothetical protein